jgi:calcineurin-like phosphoesterase family protein
MEYFFTADEHYFHNNMIHYANRPFLTVDEMNAELIKRHNKVVGQNDIVIHAGDFTMLKDRVAVQLQLISKLNGQHIFLKGSHDRWLSGANQIWEKKINEHYVVVCHYCMRTWARSHYNSLHLYGHSHGRLEPIGKSWDIGVDNNNFYPVSFEQIKRIMEKRPDNPNLVRK